MQRWARDPLIHFLIAGAALFAFFALRGAEVDPESRTIEVTRDVQAGLAMQFERAIQRPPTDAELDGLIDRWVRDEVLYREAIRLGLDRDDAVVRRRLSRKMDDLAGAEAETESPSDATLEQWLADNPERFATGTRYSFDQLWFESEEAAIAAKASLKSGAEWAELGGAISLPATVNDTEAQEIEARFGGDFLTALQTLRPSDEWADPIFSGFGWHLVRLRNTKLGTVPQFADIKQNVEAEWRSATIEARREQAFQLLRDAYSVSVEK